MTQSKLVALAQQGDPRAIATLVNQYLQPHGIQSRVTVKAGSLHLLLEAEEVPPKSTYLTQIADLLGEHQIYAFETVMVYGRKSGEKKPAWQDTVTVAQELQTIVHSDEPDLAFESAAPDAANVAPPPGPPMSKTEEPDTLLQHDLEPSLAAEPDSGDEREPPPIAYSFEADSEQNGSTAGTASMAIPSDLGSDFGLGVADDQDMAFGVLDDRDDANFSLEDAAEADTEEMADEDGGVDGGTATQPWYVQKLGLIIGILVLAIVAAFGIRFWLNQSTPPVGDVLPAELPSPEPTAAPPVAESPTPPTPPASPASPTAPASPAADPFREAVNRATSAANLTQTARTRQEWQTVANHWREAIALMQAVPADSPNYAVAQDRVVAYQRNLAYAEQVAASRPE